MDPGDVPWLTTEQMVEVDRAMIEDLVAAAVNVAIQNAQRMVQEEMQRAAGALGPMLGQQPG